MANIMRWEPLNDVVSLRDAMDRLFEESFITPRFFAPLREGVMGTLPLDVVETENDVVVKASVPGLKPEDIEVTVVGDTLTIKGETKAEKKEEKSNYLLQERRFGSFQRAISLPVAVQSDKAQADFENGVLTLTLPKAEEVKPKQIKVNMKNVINSGNGNTR
jgi:HSP20 family protein